MTALLYEQTQMFLMDNTGNDNPIYDNNNNAYDIISLKSMICLRRTLGLTVPCLPFEEPKARITLYKKSK